VPSATELINLIQLAREQRFLEYKESRPWSILREKIAKTAMGMSNIRDGGTIIIGVEQRSGLLVLEGMAPSDLATYDDDTIQATSVGPDCGSLRRWVSSLKIIENSLSIPRSAVV
jgi:hypothetical protein